MAVVVTWSTTDNGTAETDLQDYGAVSQPGGGGAVASSVLQHFIRHDGTNEITGVGFYIAEYSGTYTGADSPANDLSEILAQGDATTATAIMDALDDTPGTDSTKGLISDLPATNFGINVRTGQGDLLANPIPLPANGDATTAGPLHPTSAFSGADTATEIQSSETDVNFYTRFLVPEDVANVGVRQIDLVVTYTFTS